VEAIVSLSLRDYIRLIEQIGQSGIRGRRTFMLNSRHAINSEISSTGEQNNEVSKVRPSSAGC
jgi:hypothetical protein